jgi:hypothetical protein
MHAELAAVPDSLYNVTRANRVIAVVIWAKSFATVIKPSYKTLTFMVVTAFATVVFFAAPACSRYFVSIHQRDVARQLIEWRFQYSSIRTKADAIRTAEVLGYIQGYYVPSPGYRGTIDSEQQLNTQREATVEELIAALRTYTNVDCGKDASAWKTAIERQ